MSALQKENRMESKRPITEIIGERHANRTYQKRPISKTHREMLEKFIADAGPGPFGARARFRLIAASEEDADAIRQLGTYGVIKNAVGFIAGAVKKSGYYLEDYGYLLERIVLYATSIGLGTCWLGGTFKRSGFARKISLEEDETLPAIIATGYSMEKPSILDSIMRFGAGSKNRKPWESLFFNGDFDQAMTEEAAGAYRVPLEMVRRAPSASNNQPWRLIKEKGGDNFHFYLERTKGYYRRWQLIGMDDLQRIDMGIAMYHFEATAVESKLKGTWVIHDPGLKIPRELCEYRSTWKCG
jgi:nitroreductase